MITKEKKASTRQKTCRKRKAVDETPEKPPQKCRKKMVSRMTAPFSDIPTDSQWNTFSMQRQRMNCVFPGVPIGVGTMKDPYRIPLRTEPNATGCVHCPIGIDECDCAEIEELISKHLHGVYSTTELRRTHAYGRHPLNSKSVLPVFVSRLVRICNVHKGDVVWDLGCGIGSVVMQFALQTGSTAVGIDIQGDNIAVANKMWRSVRKEWVKRYPTRPVGDVHFVTNDIFEELQPHVTRRSAPPVDCAPTGDLASPTVVWAANLLFTPAMNNQLAQMLHRIESLRSVTCMLDLYPHNRPGVSKKRDPEPYNKFTRMEDHIAQADCFEWKEIEKRPFYTYHTNSHAVDDGS